MTKDEALKLALEALETVVVDVKTTPTAYEVQRQTITAIKEALAQPEQEPVCVAFIRTYVGKDEDGIEIWKEEPLYTTPPQPKPKQEPVAWMREDEDCSDCIVWEQTEEHTIPLYTAPPQREWVGLTDEEKSDLWCKSTGQNCVNEDTHPSAKIMNLVIRQQGFNFAKAIEAKLREKNG